MGRRDIGRVEVCRLGERGREKPSMENNVQREDKELAWAKGQDNMVQRAAWNLFFHFEDALIPV